MHKYENQILFETIQVYGANDVYARNETADKPVPMKQPFLELIVPLGMGLLWVLIIIESYEASFTYPKHWVDIAIV